MANNDKTAKSPLCCIAFLLGSALCCSSSMGLALDCQYTIIAKSNHLLPAAVIRKGVRIAAEIIMK
jgi:precorrin-3B methylase